MKKIVFLNILNCLFYCNAQAQNGPPIRVPSKEAKVSITQKSLENGVLPNCKGITDDPKFIKSSTGASGYYCDCSASNAVIFYLPNQKKSVANYGQIREKYGTQDWERGSLGFPLDDASFFVYGFFQKYEGGYIYLINHASTDKKSAVAFIVKGDFLKKYFEVGGWKKIGVPISDEENDKYAGGEAGVAKSTGIITQNFEKGVIIKKGNEISYSDYSKAPPIRHTPTETKTKVPPIRHTPTGNNIKVNLGEILATTYLEKDKPYYSQDKRYYLAFQSDGNLVLYKVGKGAIWNSHTSGTAVKTCVMQGDGNLVLYGYNNQHVWYSDKQYDGSWFEKALGEGDEFKAGGPIYKLVVQNDGNLVIYVCDKNGNTSGGVRWSSGTFEHN